MWWRHIFIRFTQTRHNFISAAKLAFPNLRHRQPETSSNDGILHRAYDQADEFKTGVHSLFFSFNGFEAIETFKESNGQWFWSALMWTKTSLQCFYQNILWERLPGLALVTNAFPHVPKPKRICSKLLLTQTQCRRSKWASASQCHRSFLVGSS